MDPGGPNLTNPDPDAAQGPQHWFSLMQDTVRKSLWLMPNSQTVFRFCMCFDLVQYEYKMDPDVESVVCFPEVSRAIELSYWAKQLIAHEIELEKMRR
jgi:hypothetical protein